jgi:DNA-binding transcriptional MerR regulator
MTDDGLTAGAVARRLGVAVTTLRTWHQRYGLGPSEHVPGHHRRYTAEDLDRLHVMRRLTTQGIAPAEAAAWARRSPAPQSPSSPSSPSPPEGRHGGGHVIPLGPQAAPAARGLARAATHLDAAAMRDILDAVIGEHGVTGAWDEVMMPVLIGIGDRYEATRRFIEVEHLVSRCITEALGVIQRPASGVIPRVLLAATDEEQHTLPLEALAAALAEAGIPTRLLGARVPSAALSNAIARTGPDVVILWSQTRSTGDPGQLTRLAHIPRPPLMIAAAGPGWPHDLPPGVTRLTTLPEAVATVAAAISPGHGAAAEKQIPI